MHIYFFSFYIAVCIAIYEWTSPFSFRSTDISTKKIIVMKKYLLVINTQQSDQRWPQTRVSPWDEPFKETSRSSISSIQSNTATELLLLRQVWVTKSLSNRAHALRCHIYDRVNLFEVWSGNKMTFWNPTPTSGLLALPPRRQIPFIPQTQGCAWSNDAMNVLLVDGHIRSSSARSQFEGGRRTAHNNWLGLPKSLLPVFFFPNILVHSYALHWLWRMLLTVVEFVSFVARVSVSPASTLPASTFLKSDMTKNVAICGRGCLFCESLTCECSW